MRSFDFHETALLFKLLEKSAPEYTNNATHQRLLLDFRELVGRNQEKQRLLKEPVLFYAKYIGDSYHLDDTFPERVYRVIGETDTQYIIINDSLSTSHLQKTKFQKVDKPCK